MIFKLKQLIETAWARLLGDPAPAVLEPRLLAEAVRLHEEAQGEPLDEPAADAAAQAAGGDLEQRLLTRAGALSLAPALTSALQHLRQAVSLLIAGGALLALIAGATSAQLTLTVPNDEPVINFFWVLGHLLGVQLLFLLLWLGLMLYRPGAVNSSSLGALVFAAGRRLTHWLHKGPAHVAAARALAGVYASSSLGRWTLSAISHGLWLAFLSGSLVLVILLLSIRQYTFAWETTILSDQSYIALTRLIAWGPEALGFLTPDAQQIAASHWTHDGTPPATAREAWSGLLIGSLVVYGWLPRAGLLVFCLLARRRAAGRWRLETGLPGYARLHSRLLPAARPLGVVDPDRHGRDWEPPAPVTVPPAPLAGRGPAAIMGFEIEAPAAAWPPTLAGVDWLDLGLVESRDDRRRVLEQLRMATIPPRLIAVVCSVVMTPDRGTRGFLHELREASAAPVLLLLTDGQRLRERGDPPDEVVQRLNDWRVVAASAEVPDERVVDVDLTHLTDASRARLAALLTGKAVQTPAASRLDQAFALIVTHAGRWTGPPPATAQAELHRAIAALYDSERSGWRTLLNLNHPWPGGSDLVGQLRGGAGRMLDLLPPRLRLRPRWCAAGALAGALSCVAAATLVTPAAIAALPLWSGLGAALAAVIQPVASDAPAAGEPRDLAPAVSSAALFALVLELQGRPEAEISRLLDRVLGDADPPSLADPAAAQSWLAQLQTRLAIARQEVAA